MSKRSIRRMRDAKPAGAAAKKHIAGSEPVAFENPLIPNKRLKALYAAMVGLRMLDERFETPRRAAKQGSPPTGFLGEEGCRVSTTFDLKPGDLTSDVVDDLATSFLRGAKMADVVRRASAAGTGGMGASDSPGQLPNVEKTLDRLHLAMGAAWTLKAMRKGALLVAYVRSSQVSATEWTPILRSSSKNMLPMIFVVLPAELGTKAMARPGQLSLRSSKCGVPGIPVDVADPVALYRVAQESMLRARAGGGPVLMECIAFHPVGKKATAADPIATMREFLLARKIVDEAWLEGVESRFRNRLEAVAR